MIVADLAARARGLVADGERRVLGITGPPGSGKTTLAVELVRRLCDPEDGLGPGRAAHLPMDGFHLADVQLDRLGLRDRKGAPPTFDVDGYVAALDRVLRTTDRPVYAPGFERELEQPVAAAVAIAPEARLVVTEGNYLLLQYDKWKRVRVVLDEAWFLMIDEDLRVARLIDRHVRYGRSVEEARERVLHGTDHVNALMVNASKSAADLVITEVL